MDEWTTVITEPTNIGNGRGFYIPKEKRRLKANTKYIVKVIELSQSKIDKAKCDYAYKEAIRDEVISKKHRTKVSR